MPELLQRWLAVESALDNWQNADEISLNNTTAQKHLLTHYLLIKTL